MGGGVGSNPQGPIPSVLGTLPLDGATNVVVNTTVNAVFNTAMRPATLNAATFTLTGPGGVNVPGTVTYAGNSNTATFTPTLDLAPNSLFTARITTGAWETSGNALRSDFVWSFTTGESSDTTAPTVTSTTPAGGAANVGTNTSVLATFSEPMNPATLNETTFTVTGPGVTPVAGTISYAVLGNTVSFTPGADLAPNTTFTATLTTGAMDVNGNPLAADFVWTFTTGASADVTPPTVDSTNPGSAALDVCLTNPIEATFSEALNPFTVNTATFRVTGPGATPVAGTVGYDAGTFVATFSPTAPLAASTQFTATLSGGADGVQDVAGNPLAVDRVWTFTTGSQACAPDEPTRLGAIAPFGTFGGGAGMTNEGILTVINGDIGTTAASTTITGFHDSSGDIYTETPLNVGTVNGTIFAAPPAPGTQEKADIAAAGAAAALAAFNDLSPANLPGGIDPGAGQLGGLTLAPGVYQAAGGTFQITGSDLTLDAQGDPNAVWVFQSASSLTVGAPGAPRNVILVNGAQAKNVYWRVGSAATINAAGGGTMVGTILASAGITFSTAGNVAVVTLNGRAIGLNASVTLVNTVINVPAP